MVPTKWQVHTEVSEKETQSRKKVRIEHRIECDEDRSKDGAFKRLDA